VQRIADMHPLFEPGTKAAYMSYTFGWVIGEVVCRQRLHHMRAVSST
jgi:hypothetical protein